MAAVRPNASGRSSKATGPRSTSTAIDATARTGPDATAPTLAKHSLAKHSIVEHSLAKNSISKHSILIAGHRTSISLERAFWERLGEVAAARQRSIASLVAEIDQTRGGANLSSAIRVFLLDTYANDPAREAGR